MAKKLQRGLGRGLGALLGDAIEETAPVAAEPVETSAAAPAPADFLLPACPKAKKCGTMIP